MRILVMGAGAMGSAVGGLMAKAGHEVTLVGRAPHVEAIRRRGLSISGIWGEHRVGSLRAETSVAACPASALDLILVTVKSYDSAQAAREIAPLVAGDTLVCSYQNGLGNVETIAQVAGGRHTFGARVIFGVRLTEPGAVTVTVIAEPTALGLHDPAVPAERVREIARVMDRAGIPTVFTDELEKLLWAKVAYNAALNPLSALLDVPYGALVETEHTLRIMREVVRELYDVAAARGVALEPPSAGAFMERLLTRLIPPTAAHYASMREDFLRHRRTEIDALNGAIVRYGRDAGIACPVNELLTNLVRAREHGYGIG